MEGLELNRKYHLPPPGIGLIFSIRNQFHAVMSHSDMDMDYSNFAIFLLPEKFLWVIKFASVDECLLTYCVQ